MPAHSRAPKFSPYRVVTLSYCTRDLTGHSDHEDGIVEAFWTGEIDTWGKYTFRLVQPVLINGRDRLFLFFDEIVSVERMVA